MQCGPIRFNLPVRSQVDFHSSTAAIPRTTGVTWSREEAPTIQDLYGLAVDAERNSQIVRDVARAIANGRSPLVLSGNRSRRMARCTSAGTYGAGVCAERRHGIKTAGEGGTGIRGDRESATSDRRDRQLHRRRLRRFAAGHPLSGNANLVARHPATVRRAASPAP